MCCISQLGTSVGWYIYTTILEYVTQANTQLISIEFLLSTIDKPESPYWHIRIVCNMYTPKILNKHWICKLRLSLSWFLLFSKFSYVNGSYWLCYKLLNYLSWLAFTLTSYCVGTTGSEAHRRSQTRYVIGPAKNWCAPTEHKLLLQFNQSLHITAQLKTSRGHSQC